MNYLTFYNLLISYSFGYGYFRGRFYTKRINLSYANLSYSANSIIGIFYVTHVSILSSVT